MGSLVYGKESDEAIERPLWRRPIVEHGRDHLTVWLEGIYNILWSDALTKITKPQCR
jgi:hypothetical protein